MKVDAPKRTLLKTLSWRLVSIAITFGVTYLITRSTRFAITISVLDNIVKMFTYYMHERYWTHVKWGRLKKKKLKKKKLKKHKIKEQKQAGETID